MTIPRSQIVDTNLTRWYHCISQCVRQAFLMKDGSGRRKRWIEDRLELLCSAFSIGVGGFSILDNHMHVVVRLDPEAAQEWSAEEVLDRWLRIFPPRTLDLEDKAMVQAWIAEQMADESEIATLRYRLSNLGWFMKALKEPLARIINKEDGCRGAFWAARYKSIAILDDEALLMTSAYVDLNPLAAGLAKTPESSKHTSLHQRVNHVKSKGQLDRLAVARNGSVLGSLAAENLDQDHWLIPLDDQRTGSKSCRAGMLNSFSLGSYLLLVDYMGRLYRENKARIGENVKHVFERLGICPERWAARMSTMLKGKSFRGHYFGSKREVVENAATQRGKRITNLSVQAA